jgi:predicted nucleic acid-binding protein
MNCGKSAMNSSTICIDAGLFIRLLAFPDDLRVQHAWESWQQAGVRICAPGLLFYEVTNALYRYQHQGMLQVETVTAALQAALALPVELVNDPALHQQARLLATRFDLPAAYDAHYLALAERLGATLWTKDSRLANKLAAAGADWVRLLGD